MDVLDYMIARGCEPNAVTYTALIYGLCKKGEIDKATEFLNDMIAKGHEPSALTYNTVIDGLLQER